MQKNKLAIRIIGILLVAVLAVSMFAPLFASNVYAAPATANAEAATAADTTQAADAAEDDSFSTRIVKKVVEMFSGTVPGEIIAFAVSVMPVLELRGGIIAAYLLDIDWIPAFIICFIGNMLPIPFILLFLGKIFDLFRRNKYLKKLVDKLEAKAQKNSKALEKGEIIGLLILVAIPLPGTGGWTGALVASCMNLPIKKSLPTIAAGVFIAGIIVTLLTYGIIGHI